MKKIEHIGIAVRDLDVANKTYTELLHTECYKQELVESENVLTSFFKVADSKIELLQATNEDSAIAKFINKRGEGLHHIAFEVENINVEMLRLKNLGYQLLNEQPKRGADHKLVCFVQPKNCHGVLIELCQTIE